MESQLVLWAIAVRLMVELNEGLSVGNGQGGHWWLLARGGASQIAEHVKAYVGWGQR
jgi:hypothetical protein